MMVGTDEIFDKGMTTLCRPQQDAEPALIVENVKIRN
jgi:hypothetical protein